MANPKLCILLVVVLALTGCTIDAPEGAPVGVRVQDSRALQAGIQYNTVVITDKSLQSWDGKVYDPPFLNYIWPNEKHKRSKIAVESTNSRRTPTGTLEIWAVLRNRTDHPLQVEGRAQFFDADKVPSDGPTAWQRVYLPPQSVATYKEFSTKIHEVSYYYVELREGR